MGAVWNWKDSLSMQRNMVTRIMFGDMVTQDSILSIHPSTLFVHKSTCRLVENTFRMYSVRREADEVHDAVKTHYVFIFTPHFECVV